MDMKFQLLPVQCFGKKEKTKAAKTKIEIFTLQEQGLGLQEVQALSVYFSKPDENLFLDTCTQKMDPQKNRKTILTKRKKSKQQNFKKTKTKQGV